MLDLSTRVELIALARIVRPLEVAARRVGVPFFLMGAAARDLHLLWAHGIDTRRETRDADFGVMVPDWDTFEALRTELIATGEFDARPGPAAHKLHHRSGSPLDIVPFGGVERPDRTLAWPPDGQTVYDCFGMQEALRDGRTVRLPEDVSVLAASVPTLAVLKACAWQDRRYSHPGRDSGDLMLYMTRYLDIGNMERAATEHPDLFDAEPYDHLQAGARLLARDIARLIEPSGVARVLAILAPEADPDGPLLMAGQSRLDLETAQGVLQAFCTELTARSPAP